VTIVVADDGGVPPGVVVIFSLMADRSAETAAKADAATKATAGAVTRAAALM